MLLIPVLQGLGQTVGFSAVVADEPHEHVGTAVGAFLDVAVAGTPDIDAVAAAGAVG